MAVPGATGKPAQVPEAFRPRMRERRQTDDSFVTGLIHHDGPIPTTLSTPTPLSCPGSRHPWYWQLDGKPDELRACHRKGSRLGHKTKRHRVSETAHYDIRIFAVAPWRLEAYRTLMVRKNLTGGQDKESASLWSKEGEQFLRVLANLLASLFGGKAIRTRRRVWADIAD